MSYKSRFRPSEVLTGGIWRVLEETMVPAEEPVVPETAG